MCTLWASHSSSCTAKAQVSQRTALPSINILLLYAESHDRVDDIVIVLPQSLNSLLTGNASLSHDKVDILSLKARLIDLLTIILLLLLLLLGAEVGDGLLSLTVVVVVVMVVTGVLTGSLSGSELLSGGSLSLGVQVLNLSLTEDAVRS